MHLYLFSCFFLGVTAILCAVGLLSHTYKENLFQNIGMGFLMVGCASRVKDIWLTESVAVDWFIIHAGMFSFALGVFLKIFFRAFHDRIIALQQSMLGAHSTVPHVGFLWAQDSEFPRKHH